MIPRAFAYLPFLDPLPLATLWPWLAVPLTLGIAIVYKCVRCRTAEQVPREAAILTAWILFALVAAAVGLTLLNDYVAR